MNKKIIGMLVIVLIGSLALVSQYDAYDGSGSEVSESFTVTVESPDSEQNEDLQVDSDFDLIPSLSASDSLPSKQLTYLYFYQPNCSNCIAIKPDVVDFYQSNLGDDFNFYSIDLTQEENSSIWADEGSMVGDKVDKVGDLKVIGTPTLVTVKDGKIESVSVGKTDVAQALK